MPPIAKIYRYDNIDRGGKSMTKASRLMGVQQNQIHCDSETLAILTYLVNVTATHQPQPMPN